MKVSKIYKLMLGVIVAVGAAGCSVEATSDKKKDEPVVTQSVPEQPLAVSAGVTEQGPNVFFFTNQGGDQTYSFEYRPNNTQTAYFLPDTKHSSFDCETGVYQVIYDWVEVVDGVEVSVAQNIGPGSSILLQRDRFYRFKASIRNTPFCSSYTERFWMIVY